MLHTLLILADAGEERAQCVYDPVYVGSPLSFGTRPVC